MSKSHQQLAVLVALVIVMVAVYGWALRPRGSSHGGAGQQRTARAPVAIMDDHPTTAGAVPAAPSEPSSQREAQQARSAHLAWGRDPFLKGGGGGGTTGLTLSGILWDPQQPIAILNGQMLHVGEELDGYQIVAIGQDRVSVTDGTETFQLLIAP